LVCIFRTSASSSKASLGLCYRGSCIMIPFFAPTTHHTMGRRLPAAPRRCPLLLCCSCAASLLPSLWTHRGSASARPRPGTTVSSTRCHPFPTSISHCRRWVETARYLGCSQISIDILFRCMVTKSKSMQHEHIQF
jgi:hypothetical protein